MHDILKTFFLMALLICFLSGCQTHRDSKAASVEDECKKFSETGDCVEHTQWPQAPQEMLVLTMPRGHAMTEPAVAFSHEVHDQQGCIRCHDVQHSRLKPEIDFSQT